MAPIKTKSVIGEHIKHPHLRFRLLVSILSLVFVLGSMFVYKKAYIDKPVETPKDTSMSDYQMFISNNVGNTSPPRTEEMKSIASYLSKKQVKTKSDPSFADYQKIANTINK